MKKWTELSEGNNQNTLELEAGTCPPSESAALSSLSLPFSHSIFLHLSLLLLSIHIPPYEARYMATRGIRKISGKIIWLDYFEKCTLSPNWQLPPVVGFVRSCKGTETLIWTKDSSSGCKKQQFLQESGDSRDVTIKTIIGSHVNFWKPYFAPWLSSIHTPSSYNMLVKTPLFPLSLAPSIMWFSHMQLINIPRPPPQETTQKWSYIATASSPSPGDVVDQVQMWFIFF